MKWSAEEENKIYLKVKSQYGLFGGNYTKHNQAMLALLLLSIFYPILLIGLFFYWLILIFKIAHSVEVECEKRGVTLGDVKKLGQTPWRSQEYHNEMAFRFHHDRLASRSSIWRN